MKSRTSRQREANKIQGFFKYIPSNLPYLEIYPPKLCICQFNLHINWNQINITPKLPAKYIFFLPWKCFTTRFIKEKKIFPIICALVNCSQQSSPTSPQHCISSFLPLFFFILSILHLSSSTSLYLSQWLWMVNVAGIKRRWELKREKVGVRICGVRSLLWIWRLVWETRGSKQARTLRARRDDDRERREQGLFSVMGRDLVPAGGRIN